jgi:hypothetical protein
VPDPVSFAAIGESLAADVTVVERGPGWVLHGLRSDAMGRAHLAASRGLRLATRELNATAWSTLGQVPGRAVERVAHALSPVRAAAWFSLALRLGVHQCLPLPSGAWLVGISGRLLHFDGAWTTALQYHGFRKPARLGLAVDRRGHAWLAEYTLNPRRRAVHLWRSDDGGRSFQVARTFAPGEVRHLHFVQTDPFDSSLWLGSGDSDAESTIWRSEDGEQWQRIGGGSQHWRAIGLCFTPDAVHWGTDAGRDATRFRNLALHWSRHDGRLTDEQPLQGPVHGVATWNRGRVLLSTGCEGGANEADPRVHLWLRETNGQWRELASWRKGLQPRQVQYAVAHLCAGQDLADDLWLQLRGTLTMPLGYVRLRVAT